MFRIAFITPSLFTLAPTWRRDPQIVKLAAPTLSGFLQTHGYEDIRQYDFEVQVFDLQREQPEELDLTVFFDDDAVDRFLKDDDPVLRKHTERICDTLEIEEADLFAFSCASALEIYADMHAAGNINMAMSKILKERFPNCKTAVGGLQISPESRHQTEYQAMLTRCNSLDYCVSGKGEFGLLFVVEDAQGKTSLTENKAEYSEHGSGVIVHPTYERPLHVPRGIARQEGVETKIRQVETPEEVPLGDHERQAIFNPSLYVTPYYDHKNIEKRKIRGFEILKRYNLDPSWIEKMAHFHDDKVVILPSIFMEGCNSQCAFCGYSMTKMAKREISDVIRGLAWLREKHDARYFHFLNTNINGYYKYAETFCDELIAADLDILWSDCANLWALDEKLLVKMRKSGAIRFTFGVECPSDKMLKYIHKGITAEKCLERLKMSHDLGIWNHILLITGLPHETAEDTKYFVDFLEKCAEHVHGYSISSFYLISTSLMGAFPQRYGIETITDAGTLLEDVAFHESNGLDWPAKKKQIVESTRIITEAIRRIKVDPKYWSGAIDLELIFWLYDRLGHDNKHEIVRAYEDAFIGAPAHPKAYQARLKELLDTSDHEATKLLEETSWRAQTDQIQLRGDAMVLPVEAGGEKLELEFRCHEYSRQIPTLAAGMNLGVHLTGEPSFSDKLKALVGPGSRFEEALQGIGWNITALGSSNATNAFGFTIEQGENELLLLVQLLSKGERAAVTLNNLGFSYSVPNGKDDPTADPKILRFVMRMGQFLLDELNKQLDPDKLVKPLTRQELHTIANLLVRDLEEPFLDVLRREPTHEYAEKGEDLRPANWGPGQRHGNKFSMVSNA
ncbi:MAG: hypothetical protein CMH54_07725 [Myxococcales bacterium]|nr:hypothetical protein [Myxococcales bacterium]